MQADAFGCAEYVLVDLAFLVLPSWQDQWTAAAGSSPAEAEAAEATF
jgi:hypothetical protein